MEQFCDAAMSVERSPGGQTFRAKWGSNRYASNFAFICLGVRINYSRRKRRKEELGEEVEEEEYDCKNNVPPNLMELSEYIKKN